MISAFGIDHGGISKKHELAYAIDDKLEGTKLSNAARVRQARRGYKHGLSPDPKNKPPKYAPPGTWPRTEYESKRQQGMDHYDQLRFGVSKKHTDAERREHYGRMSTAMGTTGALMGGVATGSAVMGHLEHKGRDPMGFTVRRHGKYNAPKFSPEMKTAILDMNAKAHVGQAKILGGTALLAGGLAAGYRAKKKKLQPVAKKRSKADIAGEVGLGAGSAALGAYTLKNGMTAHHHFTYDANDAIKQGVAGHQIVRQHKRGPKVTPKQLEHAKQVRRLGMRVGGIKQVGAKSAAAAAVTSSAGLYELARYNAQHSKKAKS